MTKWQLIAKLALTVLGIFIFVESMHYVWLAGAAGQLWWPSVYSLGIFLLFSVLVCRMLFWSDAWVERMIGPGDEDEPAIGTLASVGGFRIVLVFCGLLILAGRIEFLVRAAAFIVVAPKIIVNMIVYRYVDTVFYMSGREWLRLIVNLARAVLGIYLVLGAPRFVRWQVGKSYAPASQD
jgi:hypothetical protein